MSIFFIVGTGRCGTQMLRNILSMWHDVVVLPETHFIIPLYDKFGLSDIDVNDFLCVVDNIYGSSGKKWIETIIRSSIRSYESYKSAFEKYVHENNVSGSIREYTEAFFEFLYGKYKWYGDKTPHYGANLSKILHIWPEARIIHLVRDGIDTALSMVEHPGFQKFINGEIRPEKIDTSMENGTFLQFSSEIPTVENALQFWVNVINKTEKEFNTVPQSQRITVKYEDIMFQPYHEIYKIASFLEIQNNKKAFKKALTLPRPFPEKWQVKKISDEKYREYYTLAHETLEYYGYPYKYEMGRGVGDIIVDVYRGRYAYIAMMKKRLKKLIKQITRKK